MFGFERKAFRRGGHGHCPSQPAAAWRGKQPLVFTSQYTCSATATRAVSLPLQADNQSSGVTLGWDGAQAGDMSWSELQAGNGSRQHRAAAPQERNPQGYSAPGDDTCNTSSSSSSSGGSANHHQHHSRTPQRQLPGGPTNRSAEGVRSGGTTAPSQTAALPASSQDLSLTTQLANAASLRQLMSLVSHNRTRLNVLHATAALARLAALKRSATAGGKAQYGETGEASHGAYPGAREAAGQAGGWGSAATNSSRLGGQAGAASPAGAPPAAAAVGGSSGGIGGALPSAAGALPVSGDTAASERLRSSLSASTSAPARPVHRTHSFRSNNFSASGFASGLPSPTSALPTSFALPSIAPLSFAAVAPPVAAAAAELVALLLPLLRACPCADQRSSCVSSALHSLACLGYRSSATLHELMDVAAGVLPHMMMRPRRVARMMWALAKLNCQPRAAWLQLLMQEMLRSPLMQSRPNTDAFGGGSSSRSSSSSSSSNGRNRAPSSNSNGGIAGKGNALGNASSGAGNAGGSVGGRLATQPPPRSGGIHSAHSAAWGAQADIPSVTGAAQRLLQGGPARALEGAQAPPPSQSSVQPQEAGAALAVVMWSLGVLRARPPPRWGQAVATAALTHLQCLSAKEGLLLLWGLAKTGARPSEAQVSQLARHCLQGLPSLGLRELHPLLEACVVLDYRLGRGQLERVLRRVKQCTRPNASRRVAASDVAGVLRTSALLLNLSVQPTVSGTMPSSPAGTAPAPAGNRGQGHTSRPRSQHVGAKVTPADEHEEWLQTRFFLPLVQTLLLSSPRRLQRRLRAGRKWRGQLLTRTAHRQAPAWVIRAQPTRGHAASVPGLRASKGAGSCRITKPSGHRGGQHGPGTDVAAAAVRLGQRRQMAVLPPSALTSASAGLKLRTGLHLGFSGGGASRSGVQGPPRTLPRPSTYSSQELVQVLWACAKMGIVPPHSWLNAALAAFTDKPVGGGNLSRAAGGVAAAARDSGTGKAASGAGSGRLQTRTGNAAASSGGSSNSGGSGSSRGGGGHSSGGHVRGAGYCRLDHAQPQDMSLMMYALAKLGQLPPSFSWYRKLLMASASKLPAFSPQNLANMVWAMAELQLPPDLGWMLCWARAVRQRALPAFNWVELSQMKQGMKALGLQQQRGTGTCAPPSRRPEAGAARPAAPARGVAAATQRRGAASAPHLSSSSSQGAAVRGVRQGDAMDWTLLLPPVPHHPELLALLRDVERETQRRRAHQQAAPGSSNSSSAPSGRQRQPGA